MSQVAKRYADALFQLAQEKDLVVQINADLEELVKVIDSTPELLSLLASPKFSNERKKQIVAEIFANANAFVINALQILIEKKRVNETKDLAQEFKLLAANAQGTAAATVFSTRELTDAEKVEVSSAFGKLVGKETLTITNVIEPSLLGGVRVQIGNYIFDNTVVNKLEGLKRTLVG